MMRLLEFGMKYRKSRHWWMRLSARLALSISVRSASRYEKKTFKQPMNEIEKERQKKD